MTDSPNELTIENSAVALIEPEPWVAFGIESIDRTSSAALSDPNLRAAVEATGRKMLVMAGLVSSLAWAAEPAR